MRAQFEPIITFTHNSPYTSSYRTITFQREITDFVKQADCIIAPSYTNIDCKTPLIEITIKSPPVFLYIDTPI